MRITPNLIDATTTALNALFAFKYPADAVLSKYFRDNRALGQNDRGFIAETAYAVLRRRRLLEHLLGADVTRRRLVLAALTRLSGVSQRQLEGVVSEKEMKWVADLKGRQASELTLGEQADFPDWLADRLLNHMTPQDLLALAQGLNQSAPLDLRVNPLKAEREAVLARFAEEGIAAEAGKLSPLCIRLKAKPALQKHPLYLDGTIEVQDEGSQLLGYLLAPKRGEMVADFCAGAGGKTLLLGALMRSTGRLYAFDVSDKRLARLKDRMARSGLSNVHPVVIANENDIRIKRLAGKIDRVLVDAPCSGLGTLRRNPDLKWRQTPEGVAELARKQHDILKGASRLVKKGGRLAYATCSILPEENEAIVAAFLAENADFRQVPAQEILEKQGIALACGETLRLAPHTHGTDGFFAAVLERNP
ncbi:MAG: RsmB/NOP family class I SAM-dependent RNA methyltransferase [Rhodocyclaceae bacterium]|nr:RsmB/NOP family class I SAM-dependent RNA methyltransferase [Rhodocyclaceae bacterium]MCB1891185.1 RsmB/NOP family class I SAM-dependent RNA methyltransferase [Rhodocyclaceae bacterium]MCW5594397.1 RsmB/NOP family class I SAM-dependent RNA methyltransferase [Rhodocyclaceae bacterium]